MFYAKMAAVKTKVIDTGIFPTGHVFLGEEFNFGADAAPFCIIKQGSGDLDLNRRYRSVAHIMCWFEDSTNIEQTISNNLIIIAREVAEVQSVVPVFFTADLDIFEPFGIVVNPVPPFGGFRLDVNIEGVF